MLKDLEQVSVNELLAKFTPLLKGLDKDSSIEVCKDVLFDYIGYCKNRISAIEKTEDAENYISEVRNEILYQNNVWVNTILILSKNHHVVDAIFSFVNLVTMMTPNLAKLCWPKQEFSPDLIKKIEESRIRNFFEESIKEKLGGEKSNINFNKDEKDQYVNTDLQTVWLTFKRGYERDQKNAAKSGQKDKNSFKD